MRTKESIRKRAKPIYLNPTIVAHLAKKYDYSINAVRCAIHGKRLSKKSLACAADYNRLIKEVNKVIEQNQ